MSEMHFIFYNIPENIKCLNVEMSCKVLQDTVKANTQGLPKSSYFRQLLGIVAFSFIPCIFSSYLAPEVIFYLCS